MRNDIFWVSSATGVCALILSTPKPDPPEGGGDHLHPWLQHPSTRRGTTILGAAAVHPAYKTESMQCTALQKIVGDRSTAHKAHFFFLRVAH